MKKKTIRNGLIVLGIVALVAVFVIPNVDFTNIQLPGVGVSHKGPIVFYIEGLASDDTTDYDAAGTLDLMTEDGIKLEPSQTLGTDTETDHEYQSGETIFFVAKSTTANAFDHFSYRITMPMGDSLVGDLYNIEWSAGAEKWIVTLYSAKETTPTILGYTIPGAQWSASGTNTYDLSDNDYIVSGKLKIAIAVNYGGLGKFWDPEEDLNGQMDKLYVTVSSNITTANIGFDIQGWGRSNDGSTWFYEVPLPESGLLIRWDEEQMFGVIEIPFTLTANVLDTATTTNRGTFTFTLRECQDAADMSDGTYDSDTLTNFAGSPTAETVTIGV